MNIGNNRWTTIFKLLLDDIHQKIQGEELIKYTNNSPDQLTFLWLQLDQNLYDPSSPIKTTGQENIDEKNELR